MADASAPPAAVGVRRLEPQGGAEDEANLSRVAALHRRCLPWTASSRAGAEVVAALYRALLRDPAACVLVTLAAADGEGGFASATTDLRATETLLRRRLRERPAVFLRLAARNLLAPFHVLARLRWERTIPREGAGYILTIGATPESPFRGGDVLRALEAELAARGMREIWVDTERSNERAVRFYVRNGYEMVSTWFGQVLLKKALPA